MGDLSLVIFDVDGTLIDSQESIYAAMATAFAEIGHGSPARSAVRAVTGLSLSQAVARLAPELDGADVAAVVAGYRAQFVKLRAAEGGEAKAPLYPGARAAIEALHGRDEVLLGVATGKARRGLDHAFAAHNLDQFFVTRQTADHHPSKPHPAMIEAALAETGVAADRTVMVGDTSFDMEMAAAAGVAAIGVGWGYHPAEALADAGAAIVISEFAELAPAVARLWEGMA